MQANSQLIFIITTMDGVPLLKHDGAILTYLNTTSCRLNAKQHTFKLRTRHHSRWLTKQQYIVAQREYDDVWHISMFTLGWKWD